MQRTKTFTPPTLFTKFCPFIFFSMETGPLYNFKTIADIFTKLGSNVKHWQLMFRGKKIYMYSFTITLDEGMGRDGGYICFLFQKQTSS